MWKEESVNYQGKYYSIENAKLEPKPDPIPQIWYAGMTDASRNLISEEVDGWLMKACNFEKAKENIVDMNLRLKSKSRKNIEYSIPALTFIRDSDSKAIEHVKQLIGDNKAVLDRTLDTGLVGSYEKVARKIEQLKNIGMDHVILQLTPTLEELMNVKKLLDIM